LLSRIERGMNLFGLVGFGDGDEFDVAGRASALFRRVRNLGSHSLQVSRYLLHG
jgi:hypothetical protein